VEDGSLHEAHLQIVPTWRDRAQYGVVIPALAIGGSTLLAVIAPPPPSLPAALAFYGTLLLAVVVGIGSALTSWRARLTLGPRGLTLRGPLRDRVVSWDRFERLEVGRAYRYAGRRGRTRRWRALHVRVRDEQLPLVAIATNRPKHAMPSLVADVDRLLAFHGRHVHRVT